MELVVFVDLHSVTVLSEKEGLTLGCRAVGAGLRTVRGRGIESLSQATGVTATVEVWGSVFREGSIPALLG